ncbi:MAG: hypothetical protein OK449_10990 [Thaumarchaeota archaeon]|nr:hypothetical protein [Nitrososphaerota archaeon]
MSGEPAKGSTHHGLAFLALLAFIASFLIARTFTTFFPSTVVVTGGVHFHHFWYGLAMIVASGWLGIAQNDQRFRRVYAVVFGFGGGLVGDETGLLLTLGNYHSDLTYFVVVAVVAVSGLVILLTTSRKELEYDVFSIGNGERMIYAGIVIAGVSALPFSSGFYLLGAVTLALGILAAAAGLWWHGREKTKKT